MSDLSTNDITRLSNNQEKMLLDEINISDPSPPSNIYNLEEDQDKPKKINRKYCTYHQCQNNSSNSPTLNFHPFVKPNKNQSRAQHWIELVGRTDLSLDKIKPTTFICEKHFPTDMDDYNWHSNHDIQSRFNHSSFKRNHS